MLVKIGLRRADVQKESAELVAMDAEIFSTDHFEDWSDYAVSWITKDDEKVGSIGFVPHKTVGPSWEVDEESPGTMWLVSIGIRPKFQGKGIGTAAMHLAIKKVMSEGEFTRMTSNFRVSNQASRRLHESCGFKPVKIIPGYYRDPMEAAEVVEVDFSRRPGII
jgi:RimJ/RimL family protein N-acetyltransferase